MIHGFTDTTLINKLCTYPYINTIDHNDILNGNKKVHKTMLPVQMDIQLLIIL